MKPSKQQKAICELIKSQASSWMNSDDIDSITHFDDIEEEVSKLESTDQAYSLEMALTRLFCIVKSAGEEP